MPFFISQRAFDRAVHEAVIEEIRGHHDPADVILRYSRNPFLLQCTAAGYYDIAFENVPDGDHRNLSDALRAFARGLRAVRGRMVDARTGADIEREPTCPTPIARPVRPRITRRVGQRVSAGASSLASRLAPLSWLG